MTPSLPQLLIVAILVLLLFGGRGKISSIMGDMGKGINSFKKGIKDGADEAANAADSAIDVSPKADVKVKRKDAPKT